MCRSCALLTRANYSCGHQLLLFRSYSKFCLFYPHEESDFHMATIAYMGKLSKYMCEECYIRGKAKEMGLHGAQRHQFIREQYANSKEAASKEDAKWFLDTAKKSQEGVFDTAKVAKLHENAKSQIKYYLGLQGKRALDLGQKVNLLKTVLQVPEIIDRRTLVAAFGSYVVWNQQTDSWIGIRSDERAVLTSIARKSGLSKVLEDGLDAKKPVEAK